MTAAPPPEVMRCAGGCPRKEQRAAVTHEYLVGKPIAMVGASDLKA